MVDPLITATAIGTGIAIAQPWAIGLWKKYIRKGIVIPYVTGFMELGFAEAGPTLAIDGTLRVLHQDVFVRRVQVTLTKRRDKSEHIFDWIAFRSHRVFLTPNPSEPGFLEGASGFILTPNQPRRTCIVFSDFATQQLIAEQMMLSSAKYWELRRSKPYNQLDYKFALDDQSEFKLRYDLMDAYRKDPIHVDAYTNIDRICYWEAGKYDVELRVDVTRPNDRFVHKWLIEISEEQTRQLRLNTIGMLDSIAFIDAGLSTPPKFFSYVPYME